MLLAQPGRIGPYSLKNRVVMGPLGTNYSTTDGTSSERDRMYYEERAIGGVSMIMTEAMPVSEGARNHRSSGGCVPLSANASRATSVSSGSRSSST